MTDPRIVKFADVLVNYSTRLARGETLLLRSEPAAEELVLEVYRKALAAGANVRVSILLPDMERIFYTEAGDAQISHLSPIDMFEVENVDAYIAIRAETNTHSLGSVPPEKQARRAAALKPRLDVILQKVRWCSTLYPTAAHAQDADMSTQEFRDFVFRSVFADKKDPISEWRKVSEKQAALIAALAGKKEVRLRAPGTDLKMRIDGRIWINSDGKHNMPSGEIFTGPVEESVEGEITFTYPVVTAGREIDGIRLVFREGRVSEASATKNEDYLRKMISLDDGASRVGELGVGTNYGIDRFVKNILYDEKIGGSIHIALGNSYRETGGRNVSAVHWDMICDLRRGGEMLVDGDVFQKDGAFTV
jgi:aminopeptidase